MKRPKQNPHKRVTGESLSPAAQQRLVGVYNHLVDAILDLYDAKNAGGIVRSQVLEEPMKYLYRAKGRLWVIMQGRLRIKPKRLGKQGVLFEGQKSLCSKEREE